MFRTVEFVCLMNGNNITSFQTLDITNVVITQSKSVWAIIIIMVYVLLLHSLYLLLLNTAEIRHELDMWMVNWNV